jgi:hypothetical protein
MGEVDVRKFFYLPFVPLWLKTQPFWLTLEGLSR